MVVSYWSAIEPDAATLEQPAHASLAALVVLGPASGVTRSRLTPRSRSVSWPVDHVVESVVQVAVAVAVGTQANGVEDEPRAALELADFADIGRAAIGALAAMHLVDSAVVAVLAIGGHGDLL